MSSTNRRLLNSGDLKELYKITNPKLEEKLILRMVIRTAGKDWSIENPHLLRGYRACQSNLESRVKQYESKDLWPDQCEIGIGIFENEKLVRVLLATKLGYRSVQEPASTTPLDDILGAIGLTRNDIER